MARVLVVDDEQGMRDTLRQFLEREGHKVETASSADEAIVKAEARPFDVVLADIIMPRKSGVDLLEWLRDHASDTKVILITGEPTVETAARAVRSGAFDYLMKPVSRDDIWKVTAHAAIVKELEEENRLYRERLEALVEERTRQVLAASERVRRIAEDTRRLAASKTVLEFAWTLLDLLSRDTGAQGGSLFLREGERLRLIASLDPGHQTDCVDLPPPPRTVLHRLFDRKQAFFVHDIREDADFVASGWTGYSNGSLLAIPLQDDDGTLQAVACLHNKPEAPFNEQDVELSRIVASHGMEALRKVEILERLQKAIQASIHAMAMTMEMRDPYTAGHQRRATRLAVAIAEEMKLAPERVEGLRMAGLVHDIGKITVPAEILSLPGRISQIAYEFIKMHPQVAYDMLKSIDFPWPVARIVHQHQERLDGSGYPCGLRGDDILLEARILAVADVVEAVASHRPYRPALGIDRALQEIVQHKGTRYDPAVVQACVKVLQENGFKIDDPEEAGVDPDLHS